MTRQTRFTGLARLARGAVLGLAAVLITVLGHAGGTGHLPELGLLLLLLPLALPLGVLAADRRRSAAWTLGFVLALQVLFHLLLTIAAGHGHHGSALPSTSMTVAHVIAACAVAIVLARGDDLVHRWLVFLAYAARTFEVPAQPAVSAPSVIHLAPILDAVRLAAVGPIARRGPPIHS